MTVCAHIAGPAVGVNAKPMGARKSTGETLIQLKFANAQWLDS